MVDSLEERMVNKERKIYTVKTGQLLKLWRPSTNYRIDLIYSGIPEDNGNRFVISGIHGYLNEGGSSQLFYPLDQTEIVVISDKFRVVDVNPEEIQLQYLGKVKNEFRAKKP